MVLPKRLIYTLRSTSFSQRTRTTSKYLSDLVAGFRTHLSSRRSPPFSYSTAHGNTKAADHGTAKPPADSTHNQARNSSLGTETHSPNQSYMVPRPLPYPSTHPNKGLHRPQPGHFFATFPEQNYDILRRIYWKRRGYFMAVNIPPLASIERVSTSVWRVLGGNPSKFTLQGTNTYLLGTGKERILVDTAQGLPEWKRDLGKTLSEIESDINEKAVISTCILTHWHHDHVMGIPDTKALSPNVKIHKHLSNEYDPDQTLTKETILDIADGQRFSVGSDATGDRFEVETVHAPGHARDHMCLLITASPDPQEVGCIFTADNVLGHGTAVFEDLAQYISSLHLMRKRVGVDRRAFPGHGAVITDAKAKLDEYIVHRQMREDEAVNVLVYGTTVPPGKQPLKTAAGFPQSQPPPKEGELGYGKELVMGKEWESMEMVKIIYRMYPENLWGPAEGGLLQVLDKLKKDGKVVKTPEGKWKASEETMSVAVAEAGAVRSESPAKL